MELLMYSRKYAIALAVSWGCRTVECRERLHRVRVGRAAARPPDLRGRPAHRWPQLRGRHASTIARGVRRRRGSARNGTASGCRVVVELRGPRARADLRAATARPAMSIAI